MAHEHDGSARRHHRQHGLQIPAQLRHGVRIRRRLARLAVSSLVVEDHPNLGAPLLGQPRALKMEGAHAQTEAVSEDDRQTGVLVPHLAHRQRHTIGGGDDDAAIGVEKPEILVFVGVLAADAAAQRAGDRHRRGGSHGGHARRARQPARTGIMAVRQPGFLIAQRI